MFKTIFPDYVVKAYSGTNPPMMNIGSLDGKSIKIYNLTRWGLRLFSSQEEVGYVPAYQYAVMDNDTALTVQFETTPGSSYEHPTPYVKVQSFKRQRVEEEGFLIQTQAPQDEYNVAGDVNIANTPAVTMSGTANVAIQGTPSVTIANAQVPITGNVGITSGTINANIQNATLNTKETSAYISSSPSYLWGSQTFAISLGTGASTGDQYIFPLAGRSFVDAVAMEITNTNAAVTNLDSTYEITFYGLAIQGGHYYTPNKLMTLSPAGFHVALTEIFSFQKSVMSGDLATVLIRNKSGVAVTDTLTFKVYFRYASSLVTNQSNQPVPTTGNYFGTGADGTLVVTSGSYNIPNQGNVPCIKNYSSINISAGAIVSFTNQAKFAILYSTGDVNISGTLYAPSGLTNIGPPTGTFAINGKIVPNAGNGGAGGAGGNPNASPGVNGTAGAAGGAGNCFAAGSGGGGGGGGAFIGASASLNPTNAFAGGTGYANLSGGTGGFVGAYSAQNGSGAATTYTGTLCIVAAGNITVGGTIIARGINGGAGGAGFANGGAVSPSTFAGGGGGSCGSSKGGNGGAGQTNYNLGGGCGGGGAGGAGGGVVFLYAGANVDVTGTINVSGGSGGAGGAPQGYNSFAGTAGTAGQAGTVAIWKMGGNLSDV